MECRLSLVFIMQLIETEQLKKGGSKMEALILCLIFAAAYLVGFKPERKKAANILLCLSIVVSVFVWLIATWGQIVPVGNL